MPDLVRMYIRHTLIGFAVSAVFVVGLFYFNVANLWHLVTHTQGGVLAAFLLFMFNGIVFSGVQFGIAVMRMAEDDTPSGGRRRPVATDIPARVRVGATASGGPARSR